VQKAERKRAGWAILDSGRG